MTIMPNPPKQQQQKLLQTTTTHNNNKHTTTKTTTKNNKKQTNNNNKIHELNNHKKQHVSLPLFVAFPFTREQRLWNPNFCMGRYTVSKVLMLMGDCLNFQKVEQFPQSGEILFQCGGAIKRYRIGELKIKNFTYHLQFIGWV